MVDMGKIKEYRFLILLLTFFCIVSIILTWSWEGQLTRFWHGGTNFEQTSVALNYPKYGILYPYSLYSGKVLHLPPLYSWLVFIAIKLTGWIEAGKIISLIFGVLTLIAVYKICEILALSKKTSLMSSLLLATSPLFLMLSSTIMQETTMLFFSTISILLLAKYLEKEKNSYIFLSGFTVFLSAFAKWPGIFTLVPFFLCLLRKEGVAVFRKPSFYFIMLFPIVLCGIWAFHLRIIAGPEIMGRFGESRLFYNLDVSIPELIFVTAKKWILFIPVTTLIFLILGFSTVTISRDRDFLLLSWLSSGVLFYILFLQGSFVHNHYTALGLPPLSIIATLGVPTLSNRLSGFLRGRISSKNITAILGLILVSATITGSIFYPLSYKVERQKAVEAREIGDYIQKINESRYKIGLLCCHPIFFTLKIDNISKIEVIRGQNQEQYEESIQSTKPEILIVDMSHEDAPTHFQNYFELKSFEYYSVFALKNLTLQITRTMGTETCPNKD